MLSPHVAAVKHCTHRSLVSSQSGVGLVHRVPLPTHTWLEQTSLGVQKSPSSQGNVLLVRTQVWFTQVSVVQTFRSSQSTAVVHFTLISAGSPIAFSTSLDVSPAGGATAELTLVLVKFPAQVPMAIWFCPPRIALNLNCVTKSPSGGTQTAGPGPPSHDNWSKAVKTALPSLPGKPVYGQGPLIPSDGQSLRKVAMLQLYTLGVGGAAHTPPPWQVNCVEQVPGFPNPSGGQSAATVHTPPEFEPPRQVMTVLLHVALFVTQVPPAGHEAPVPGQSLTLAQGFPSFVPPTHTLHSAFVRQNPPSTGPPEH